MHDGPGHKRVRGQEQQTRGGPAEALHLHSHIADDAFGGRRLQQLLQHLEAVQQRVGLVEVVRTAVPAGKEHSQSDAEDRLDTAPVPIPYF